MGKNTMQYRNNELLIDIEKRVQDSIINNPENKYRDKFFPKLIDLLDLKVGAEIGVDKGEFSKHLLSSKIEKLFGIDLWMDDFGSDFQEGAYDPSGENRMKVAKDALALDIESERVTLIKLDSRNASGFFNKDSLDFCYLDGDHSLEGIYNDVYLWVPKVRVGGIVAGHDYKDGPNSGMKDYFGNQLPFRVKTVVDDFCSKYGFKVNVVGGRILSWWFVKI